MRHHDLNSFLARGAAAPSGGPIALILAEDTVEIDSTVAHHLNAGFARVAVFAAPGLGLDAPTDPRVALVDCEVRDEAALPRLVNAVIGSVPAGSWIYYGYNAEYLLHPYAEHRGVAALCGFAAEERRDSVMCYTVDLYAGDLAAHPDGVSRDDAWFDRSGYYALARQGGDRDRQVDIFGGLRWRHEEHVPETRRRIDRVALFRSKPGLELGPELHFNDPEYNTYACPWHHSPTAAVCSFRAAKALRRNPASRAAIDRFTWPGSERFEWRAQQLLELGLMEPGQWV